MCMYETEACCVNEFVQHGRMAVCIWSVLANAISFCKTSLKIIIDHIFILIFRYLCVALVN